MELSLTTLNIIIGAKIILFSGLFMFLILLVKKNQPRYYLLLITGCFFIFYLILSYPLKRTFWGAEGDEVFMLAFLNRVLNWQIWHDFFYADLPPFYPPLYFWVTGLIAKFFTSSAIVAAKIGVLGSILLAFLGSYFFQEFFWAKSQIKNIKIVSQNWFWLVLPVLAFISMDFSVIITKPYEFVAALFSLIWLALFYIKLQQKEFNFSCYLFFGLSGGILFLVYYFWWLIIVPVILVLALLEENKLRSVKRIVLTGSIIFIMSLVYLLPLIYSFCLHGLENWQAQYLVPFDFTTFMPWFEFSLRGFLALLGMLGLFIFRKNRFIRACLFVFVACYLYQLINFLTFLIFKKTFQPSKPFLFLAGLSLMVGAAYFILVIFDRLKARFSVKEAKLATVLLVLIFLPIVPMVGFIDNKDIQEQIEKDLAPLDIVELVNIIKDRVPDYKDRVWFTSGLSQLNVFLPLNYYLAYNAHFSHQASLFSRRLAVVKNLVAAENSQQFEQILAQDAPEINTFLLYKKETEFLLYYWIDNFPNGGKTLQLKFNSDLIDQEVWQEVFSNGEWLIFIRK